MLFLTPVRHLITEVHGILSATTHLRLVMGLLLIAFGIVSNAPAAAGPLVVTVDLRPGTTMSEVKATFGPPDYQTGTRAEMYWVYFEPEGT